ncbi:MAG: 30S ribosomal protein S24e [Candidatus Lokiarchaeota archaeon]|nr:30S ribosomal protein S24e [Candidatus Lokiarchaeota archaeon]MBD3337701.1 30S ribosomal protein S24e [Candidatus Lokiarchaeota archaeon]
MSFEIEIVDEKKNPLIDRKEVTFTIEHFGKGGTPNRLEIKKKIAAMQGAKESLTIVKKINTKFGSNEDIGKVYIYDTQDELKYFEPFHIRVRNLPLDQRKEIYKLKRKRQPYEHLFNYD